MPSVTFLVKLRRRRRRLFAEYSSKNECMTSPNCAEPSKFPQKKRIVVKLLVSARAEVANEKYGFRPENGGLVPPAFCQVPSEALVRGRRESPARELTCSVDSKVLKLCSRFRGSHSMSSKCRMFHILWRLKYAAGGSRILLVSAARSVFQSS